MSVSTAGRDHGLVVIQVSATVKAEHAARFYEILRQVVAEARRSEGCRRYDWFRAADNERDVFVYGEFDSEDAFREYRRGPIVKMIGDDLIPLLEARPAFTHFAARVIDRS